LNEIDKEKAILEEAPDFDNQLKILEEEQAEVVKKRKWYILILSIFLCVVLIFVVSYSTVYHYREYGPGQGNASNCQYVNLKINGSPVPNLNITDGKDCKPVYNIDYYNNRKPTFNIDIYGDRTVIFNKTNQLDSTGSYCVLNCDSNGDGWPDYNLDLDGNGTADINIVKNPNGSKNCNLNCDINFDTIPDLNIDTDGDGIADINITDGEDNKPKYNIDYKGNRKPIFNVKDNGEILNLVTDINDNPNCERNCDLDGDGWPDYNIVLSENSIAIINELIEKGTKKVEYNNSKNIDWKCGFENFEHCKTKIETYDNKYINIDINGDGIPDVNISNDGGKTISNPINKDEIINVDDNNDGFPDYNIDINGDGIPDLNVIENNKNKCEKNCDTNKDGKKDYLIEYPNNTVSISNLNIDIDYDGICDINCDLNFDLIPDLNIDIDGDNIADLNIDYNHDKIADFNIDTNGDGIANNNLDAYGIGVCNFNCAGLNNVNNTVACTKNCDTDNDGWPDVNVDLDGNGVCDFNCEGNSSTIDKDNNYYLDSEYNSKAILDIIDNGDADFYIMNPLEIKSESIEPGWNDKYVIEVKNNAHYAVAYRIVWENVVNEFTDVNNLDYSLSRSNTGFLDNLKAPRNSIVLKDNKIIRNNSSAKFVLDISFKETGINQNIDSGKTFKGQLKIEVIK